MDDAAEAPLSQFSGSDFGALLEQALGELASGSSTAPLEPLDERAEREGSEAALAAAYAELVAGPALATVPHTPRLEVLLKTAWLCSQHEQHEAVALQAATQALDLAPADERALAIAEPLWLEGEEYGELANRYAAAATSAGSEVRARRLLERAIHMLGDNPAAAPAVVGLNERLARLPELRETDDALLARLTAGGADVPSILVKLGERWLSEGRAREGLALLPPNLDDFKTEPALDVLERLFDQAEALEPLEQLLRRRIDLEQGIGKARAWEKLAVFQQDLRRDAAAAAAAFFEAAETYVAAREDDDAERAYARVLDLDEQHLAAAKKLVTLRARASDFTGVADAFGVVLRASDDNRAAADVLLSIARDAERAGAAEEFAELADNVQWRLSADERDISEQLMRESAALFTAQARYDEAAELYRRLIADRATSEDLDRYHALIEANPGSEWRRNHQRWLFEWQEHHTSDRPTILLSWAHFEERELGDPRAALNVLERAAELAPDRAEVWDDLLRLRLGAGDGAGSLTAAAELRRLGRDVDGSLLGLLLEQEPTARFAFDRLKIELSNEQRWPELFELYDRAIAATSEAAERARWLDEAAIAARDVAQDRGRATHYWQAYAELLPEDARVDLALERLYDQAGDKPALIRHLQRRLSRQEGAERAALLRRLSVLCLDAGAFAEALTAAEHLSGFGEDNQLLLEDLFARSIPRNEQPGAREAGRRAAELLRRRYAELEQPTESARLLRAELGLVLEAAERRELLMELSRLCERELADLPAAFDAERSLFELTWAERERKRLEKLAKKLGRWAELGEIYESAADSELSPDERRSYLRRSAELATSQLGDVALATRRYRRLFEVEPEQAISSYERLQAERGPAPAAFEALCGLLASARRFDELEAVLVQACENEPSPALFSRLGRLRADERGDIAGAIAAHLSASDARAAGEAFLRRPSVFGENDVPALELAGRLSQSGLPEGALRVLRHQLDYYGAHFTTERKRVVLALIQTLGELGQRDAASHELAEAAKHFPTDPEVQRASAEDAVARGDLPRAEQGYRALLLLLHGRNDASTPHFRSAVYVELAAIKLKLGDASAAQELVESGFEMALGNVRELSALVQALTAHEQWDAAERATLALLELGQDLQSSASALRCVKELALQPRALSPRLLEQAQHIAEQARVRYRELDEPAERSTLLAACVSLLPLPEARRLLTEGEQELAAADATQARLALARRLLDAGSEPERAEALTQLRVLTSHPAAPTAAWQLLTQALEQAADSAGLRAVLESWLEREPQDAALLERALGAAVAAEDGERSLALYDRLLQLGAALSPEQASALRQLCLKAGHTARAVQLLRAEAEREAKPAKRASLLLEVAGLLLAADNTAQAREAAQEARSLDPTSADAVWTLAQLAIAADQRDEALALLSAHLESKERRRGKPLGRVLRLAADLHLERDQLSEALPLLVEAHQLDKTDLDTALLLGLLAIDLDRLETAASALRVLIAQRELGTRDGAAARGLNLAEGYFQLARIEQHHGKKTNAKRMALRALEENPALAKAQTLLNELALP